MSLFETVRGERVHIGFFGLRNAGKSSLVNAVTGQEVSVVSPVKGTTTDPVKKAMELLPLGPVLLIDTPGYDDEGTLGDLRVRKTKQELARTDIAVLVIDARRGKTPLDEELLSLFRQRKLPYLIVYHKADLAEEIPSDGIGASALTGMGIWELKERLGEIGKRIKGENDLLADLVQPGDAVVLVTPIDEAAPKGRLILPQQQTLRELLDFHCIPICCQHTELKKTLEKLTEAPKLVITDSQVFQPVSEIVPEGIPLTSFSILFARYKGNLKKLAEGAKALSGLKTGDRVLISEGCTHHRQCNDIGTVKLPDWLRRYTGADLRFSFTSGGDFPEDLSDYALVVHCGGCMLKEGEMKGRIAAAKDVPMVNYGIAISQMKGLLERSLRPFPELND